MYLPSGIQPEIVSPKHWSQLAQVQIVHKQVDIGASESGRAMSKKVRSRQLQSFSFVFFLR